MTKHKSVNLLPQEVLRLVQIRNSLIEWLDPGIKIQTMERSRWAMCPSDNPPWWLFLALGFSWQPAADDENLCFPERVWRVGILCCPHKVASSFLHQPGGGRSGILLGNHASQPRLLPNQAAISDRPQIQSVVPLPFPYAQYMQYQEGPCGKLGSISGRFEKENFKTIQALGITYSLREWEYQLTFGCRKTIYTVFALDVHKCGAGGRLGRAHHYSQFSLMK